MAFLSLSTSRVFTAALSATAVLLTAGCGGGGNDGATAVSSPMPSTVSSSMLAASPPVITRVVVAGDSLADVGTFGLKATVQNAANPAAGYPVYPEIVARDLGLGTLCNHFSSSNGVQFTSQPGCTDFAVGGADVVNPFVRAGSRLPFSLQDQLQQAVNASGGAWLPGDLVIVDAGANDAVGLATTYRDARHGGTSRVVYLALLAQQLSLSTITKALRHSDGGSVVAGLYMQQLARTYWATVKANTLDRGAMHVALLDAPDITLTPKFRGIVAEIAATEGAAAAADYQAALRQWIATFNAELAQLVAGDPRVVLVPFSADLAAQAADPAAFGLSNVTDASCPPAGDFPACTDAALDASPPAGLAPGWWKTWAFSDAFHPSPRGHELLAATVERALATAGWR